MKKILFVCKFNRFRSQIASGWFNKLNTNKNYFATSAGVIKGSSIGVEVKDYASKNKLKLSSPRGLERSWLNSQDMIVIVANDVHPSIFKTLKSVGKRIVVWKINDVNESGKGEFMLTINKIKSRVQKLVQSLK
ncbi:MAG: hypothetical protein Q7R96_02615 [Nanoarchaeota archaeon]|nr:hypothetical protein [Nanoarchaeota archaeon]